MKLELSNEQIEIINAALANLPYKIVKPIYDDMNEQIEAHNLEVARQLEEQHKLDEAKS